jgi:N-acetylmuramoyl-L-alanine amidase
MPIQYQVTQGDCILTIAEQYKVPWDKIWNHPNNADLKKQRKNPNVLYEGDRVYVPDIEQAQYPAATGATHRFVLNRRMAKLRVRVVFDPGPKPAAAAPPPGLPSPDTRHMVGEDTPVGATRDDEPRKEMAYRLTVDDVTMDGRTDADGFLECEIPQNATSGHLVLLPGTPHETEVPLLVGHLDPIEEVSGVKQRLKNLCFDCGDQTNEVTPDLEDAVSAFQSKYGLPSTGQLDDATRAAILKAHIT